MQERRLRLLLSEPSTAPNKHGVLVIDEHGDRKRGHQTAHIGKQYLANLGKIDTGVVSVTSLWADEQVYYPVDFEPYTPAHHFVQGKKDPQFRTKLKLAVELVRRAISAQIPFRAVVADSDLRRRSRRQTRTGRSGSGLCPSPQPLPYLMASRSRDWLIPGGGTDCWVAERRATRLLGEGDPHVP